MISLTVEHHIALRAYVYGLRRIAARRELSFDYCPPAALAGGCAGKAREHKNGDGYASLGANIGEDIRADAKSDRRKVRRSLLGLRL